MDFVEQQTWFKKMCSAQLNRVVGTHNILKTRTVCFLAEFRIRSALLTGRCGYTTELRH